MSYTLNSDIFSHYDDFEEACKNAALVIKLTRADVIIRKDFKPIAVVKFPDGSVDKIPEGGERQAWEQQKKQEESGIAGAIRSGLMESVLKLFSSKKK